MRANSGPTGRFTWTESGLQPPREAPEPPKCHFRKKFRSGVMAGEFRLRSVGRRGQFWMADGNPPTELKANQSTGNRLTANNATRS